MSEDGDARIKVEYLVKPLPRGVEIQVEAGEEVRDKNSKSEDDDGGAPALKKLRVDEEVGDGDKEGDDRKSKGNSRNRGQFPVVIVLNNMIRIRTEFYTNVIVNSFRAKQKQTSTTEVFKC